MIFVETKDVIAIHEHVIEPHEVQGLAANKSIEAVVQRVLNRAHYGMIEDVCELAACYACYIVVGHAFNDANKRTAFRTMMVVLQLNGYALEPEVIEVGDLIRRAAQGTVDEYVFAAWLRSQFS